MKKILIVFLFFFFFGCEYFNKVDRFLSGSRGSCSGLFYEIGKPFYSDLEYEIPDREIRTKEYFEEMGLEYIPHRKYTIECESGFVNHLFIGNRNNRRLFIIEKVSLTVNPDSAVERIEATLRQYSVDILREAYAIEKEIGQPNEINPYEWHGIRHYLYLEDYRTVSYIVISVRE